MDLNVTPASVKDFPGTIRKYYREGERFYFDADNTKLEVKIVTDNIIRFRFNSDYFAKDFSYAIDPAFNPAIPVAGFSETDQNYIINTTTVRILINKNSLKIRIENPSGSVLCEDEMGYHWEANAGFGGNYVYCSKIIQNDECFFGLGDKPCDLNLRGRRFLNWGTDTYGFAKEQDPLYRNIPFYYGLHDGEAYGLFFDNSFQSYFDFGFENPDVASFWAEGGEMCYYFIAGPSLINVAERYAQLTGKPELPPLWSLGYHQSKWSYYPDSLVKEVASTFRQKSIPCDAIHLDIDYMDGFRCFTWDNEKFPNPGKMIKDLNSQGFEVVLIIDPGIKIDPEYSIYKDALEKGYFCRRQDGDLMHGKVWPGECNFPDFTDPVVRDWWSELFKDSCQLGVSGIWNDMNEPAVFEIGTFPDDVRHNYDGLDVSHRRGHNVYGMQMARATYEGLKKYRKDKRPFVLTRSGFSGVQRFSAVWTGDNISTWEHLWIANMQCQRLSVSGISFCGSDIGGFIGEPDGELFVRFIQMAVFHPFFRGHSSKDHGDKEPWAFGEVFEAHIKKAIELRYQLLPYIYTTFWQHTKFGTPMIRPLAFLSQKEKQTLFRMEEFGFGDSLLVCPIARPGITSRKMYLPEGNWFNYWDGKSVKGGHEIIAHAGLDTFPLYVRSGAVIPHFPVINTTASKPDEIIFNIYFSFHRRTSFHYIDQYEGYGYKNEMYLLEKFTIFGNRRQMRILKSYEGGMQNPFKKYTIKIFGLPFVPSGYEIDHVLVKLPSRYKNKSLTIEVTTAFNKIRIIY